MVDPAQSTTSFSIAGDLFIVVVDICGYSISISSGLLDHNGDPAGDSHVESLSADLPFCEKS